MVAHHAALVHVIQRAIVIRNLHVPARAVAEITRVLRVKCPLHGGQLMVGLPAIRVIHFLYLNY